MTISAINAETTDMMLVAEGNRLHDNDVSACDMWRSRNLTNDRGNRCEYEDSSKDTDPGDRVEAAVKDLWHRRVSRNSAVNRILSSFSQMPECFDDTPGRWRREERLRPEGAKGG